MFFYVFKVEKSLKKIFPIPKTSVADWLLFKSQLIGGGSLLRDNIITMLKTRFVYKGLQLSLISSICTVRQVCN